ncbi:DExH-box ATP-dependent RNA helicase DExH7 [Diplonema papillatum]|nr:DExH-box ATP-dependent RNA helicase DExH7 [Diplonema papillatum]
MPSATRVVLSRTFEDELLSFVLRFDDPEEQRQRAGDVPFPTRAKGKLSALHASLTKTGFAVSSVEACLENPTIASVPAATAWLCKRAPRDHLPALWVDPRHKGHAAGSAPQAAVPSTSPTGTGAGEASDAAAGSAERRTQGGGAPAAEKRDGSTEGTEQAPPGSEKTQDGSAAPSGGDRDRGHHGGPTTEQAPASGRAAESEQTQDGASLPGGGGGRDRDHTHDTDSPGPTTAGGDGLEPSPVAVQPEQVPASGRPAESEQTQDGASLPGGGGDRDRDRDHAHDDDGGPTGEDGGDGLETSPEALQADAAAACESAAAPEPTPADEEQSGSDDGGDEEESADAPDHSNKNSTVSQPASEAKPGTEGGGSGAKAKAPEPAPPAKKPEKPAKDKKEAKEKKDKKDKKEKKDKKDKDKKDKKEKKDKAHDPAPEASAQDDDPPPQAPDDKKKKKKANTKGRNPLKAQHLERKAEQEQQRASEAPEDPKDKRQQQIAQELRALGGRPPTELLKEYAAKRRLQVQWERQRSQKEDPQGTVRIMGVLVDPTQRTRETQRTEYHPRGAETFPSFKPAMEHAATSILYHILHPQNIPLYRSMLPEFRALWLDWASVDDDERQRALCSDEERKNTFLDRVMARDRELVKRATHLKLWKETPVDPEKALAFEVLRVDDVIEPEPEDQCEGAGLLGNQPMDMNDDSASEASVEDWEDETPAGFSQADLEARRAWCDRLAAGPPMQSYWDDLPISSVKRQFLYELKKAHCVVVSSETGSGKTTQIPRYVLEEAVLKKGLSTVNIYVCEPRKLSAVAAATRVAQELNIKLDSTSIIGYRYRGAKHVSPACRLTFCTTGILLRLLRNDPLLSNITHVIVDEVHERSLVTDFLLQILKDVMYVRRDLRVILMSATIEPEFYSNYFNRMPIVTAPGRTFRADFRRRPQGRDDPGRVRASKAQVCRSFARGKCTFKDCKYVHEKQ